MNNNEEFKEVKSEEKEIKYNGDQVHINFEGLQVLDNNSADVVQSYDEFDDEPVEYNSKKH